MTTTFLRKSLFLCLLTLVTLAGFAQTPTQTIRGTVYDASQSRPLTGASVVVQNSKSGNANTGAITDEQGHFRLTNLPIGRHQLSVSFVGYEPSVINEVLVESGKVAPQGAAQ